MRPSPRLSALAARTARFGGVGLAATGLYAVLALVLERMGLAPTAASMAAYALAAAFSFTAHRGFTFRVGGPVGPQMLRFALTSAAGLLIATVAPLALVNGLGLPSWTAVAATCLLVPILSYVALAAFVFARQAPITSARGS